MRHCRSYRDGDVVSVTIIRLVIFIFRQSVAALTAGDSWLRLFILRRPVTEILRLQGFEHSRHPTVIGRLGDRAL